MKTKTKTKKRDKKINGRNAYDVYDGDGNHLGHVWYVKPSHGGGERWGAKTPDGKELETFFGPSNATHLNRSGAIKALEADFTTRKLSAQRDQQLLEIGVEIIGNHYWHGQKRILEMLQVGNTISGRALSFRDKRLATGNWHGEVYGNGKTLVEFESETELLKAAIKLIDEPRLEALDEYNKKTTSVLTIHEEHAPDGVRYRIGHSRDQCFPTALEALAFVLGNLTIEVDNVKQAIQKVRGV